MRNCNLPVLSYILTCADAAFTMQFDGGRTYTEPSCIMTGYPEGLENVRILHSLFGNLACLKGCKTPMYRLQSGG